MTIRVIFPGIDANGSDNEMICGLNGVKRRMQRIFKQPFLKTVVSQPCYCDRCEEERSFFGYARWNENICAEGANLCEI